MARHILEHADQPLTLAQLAERAGCSPTQLQKRFKALLGMSPKAFQDAARLQRMKGALRDGDSVTEAIYGAGFGSSSRAYAPGRELGMTPRRYARGGSGEQISYACVLTAYGWLLMAATDRGVCCVQFGSAPSTLLTALREEFPQAELTPAADSGQLHHWLTALSEHLQSDGPSPQLPLDLRGTAFQTAVWRFLTGLQRGQTLSYAAVAEAVGSPRAVRAAASACARNRIAVLVPCHRVLRSDGEVGGYRWGEGRKAALLAAEGATTASLRA